MVEFPERIWRDTSRRARVRFDGTWLDRLMASFLTPLIPTVHYTRTYPRTIARSRNGNCVIPM